MTGKKKVIAAICGVLCLGTALAAGGCKNTPTEPEDQAPVLSVENKDEFSAKSYVVGKPMTIPKASAQDQEDDDLTTKVRLKVLFMRSGENVLLDGEEEEVKGNTVTTFTPTKCGSYKAIYTVRDSGGNITREEIPFTVVASGEERAHQLLSEAEKENWVLDEKGTAFNKEGGVTLASTDNTSVAYKGKKLKSGDLVEFRFNAQPGASLRYFTVGGFLSRSYLQDEPANNESMFAAGYLYICVTDGMYEIWLCRGNGFNDGNGGLLTRQSYNMFDGKDHTIAYRATLQGGGEDASILFEVWIDEEVTGRASFLQTITAEELKEHYAEQAQTAFDAKFKDAPEEYTKAELKAFVGDEFDSFYADMFEEGSTDETTISLGELETKYKTKFINREFGKVFGDMFSEENFGGFFNVGAASGDAQIELKSVGFNGEQQVGAPTLAVDFEDEKVNVVNNEITFPKPKLAEDGNDYSDLSKRVKLTVIKKANGDNPEQTFELDGFTFTPEDIGFYTLVYTVTDYSGNKAFVYHDFSVARTENDQPPVIELSSTDDIIAKAGQTVTLPTLVSALDPDNNDFSSAVKVELVGPEAQTVVSGGEHIFYTAGEHWVRFSVTDYTGKLTTKDVKVIISADNDWLIDLEPESFNSNVEREYDENHKTTALKFYDGYSAGFNKQKIYGEKVSVLLDAKFATGWGTGDGINMLQIGLRTEKYADQNTNEKPVFDRFDWLNGLYMEINTVDGIAVYGGKREGGQIFKVAPSQTKSVRDLFDGETVFSWQVTDVYNDAGTRITGIKIEMWINGEPICLDPDNESDAYVIPAKRIQPYMTKSGWLCFYANGQGKNYDPTLIRAITIDGSTPEVLSAKVPEEVAKEADAGASYALPEIVATLGGNPIAAENIEVYVLPYGSDEKSEKMAIGDSLTVGEDYYAGFTVVYYYNGREIARYTVTVSMDIGELTYSADTSDLRAEVGKAFAVPQVTSYKMGQVVCDDVSKFNVKVLYDAGAARKEIALTEATFTPLEKKSFKLLYYFGEQKVDEKVVFIPDGGDVENLIAELQPSDYIYSVNDDRTQKLTGTEISLTNNLGNSFLYTGHELYDEKVTLTIDAHLANEWQSALGGSSVIFFKLRGQPTNGKASFKDWPYIGRGDDGAERGLYFSLKAKEGFILEYGKRDSSIIKRFNPVTGANDGNAGSYWEKDYLPAGSQLSWQCTDVFENGEATGVRVQVWMKAPTAEKETVVFDEIVKADGKPDLFQSYNLLVETYTGYQEGKDDDRGPTMIRNIKIERTAPARVIEYEAKFNGENSYWTYAGKQFTVPEVTIKHNGKLLGDDEYETFIVGKDGAETACARSFMLDEKYGGGYSIVYKHNGKEVLRTGTYFVISAGETTKEGDEFGAVGYEFMVNDVAFSLDGGNITTGAVSLTVVDGVSDSVQIYLVAKGTTERVAYAPTAKLGAAFANGFTVIYSYNNIDLISYEVSVYAADTQAQATATAKRGKIYTAPEVGVKVDGQAPEQAEITVEILFGEDGKRAYTEAFTVDEALYGGFTVVYKYEGKEIYAITVEVAEPGITVTPIEGNELAALGDTYTVPELTATSEGDPVAQDDIKKYIVIGDEPQDYTGVDEAEASFTVGEAHKNGFKVVYRIDGKTVYTHEVTVAEYKVTFENDEALTAIKGENFAVPAFTLKLGETEISASKAEVWVVFGENAEDKAIAENGLIDIKDNYGETVKLQVIYHGILLAEREITVADDETPTHVLVWQEGEPALTAQVNKAYAVAQPTRIRVNGERVDLDETHKVTVELNYTGGSRRKAIAIEGESYTPVEQKSFTLTYSYNGTVVAEFDVVMENTGDIANLLDGIENGTYVYKVKEPGAATDTNTTVPENGKVVLNGSNSNVFLYKKEHFYDEKITVNLDAYLARWSGSGDEFVGAEQIAFNLRGKIQHEADPENWPYIDWNATKTGLYLSVSTNLPGAKKCGIQLIYVDENHKSWDLSKATYLSWWDCEKGADKEGDEGYTNFQGYWEDKYLPAGSDLSWQVTDVFNAEGEATGVRVQVWIKTKADPRERLIIDKVVSEKDENGTVQYGGLFESYYFSVEASSRNGAGGNGARGPIMVNSINVERNPQPENTEGNLLYGMTESDYKISDSNATVTDGAVSVKGAGTFVYTKQTFYDEKVSIVIEPHLSESWSKLGIWAFAINLRGDNTSGTALEEGGNIVNNANGANSGLWLCLQSGEGFRLCYGDRDTGAIKRYNPVTGANDGGAGAYWEETYLPAGTQLNWQITDLLGEDGTTKTGVKVEVWLKAPNKDEVKIFDETIDGAGKDNLFNPYHFFIGGCGNPDNTHGIVHVTSLRVEEATKQD